MSKSMRSRKGNQAQMDEFMRSQGSIVPYDRFGPAKDKVRKAGQVLTDSLGVIDDDVQGVLRQLILGTRRPGKMGTHGTMKEALVSPFLARPGAKDEYNAGYGQTGYVNDYRFDPGREGQAAMLASRALQAGALVGTGAALGAATNAIGDSLTTAMGLQPMQQSPGAVMPM